MSYDCRDSALQQSILWRNLEDQSVVICSAVDSGSVDIAGSINNQASIGFCAIVKTGEGVQVDVVPDAIAVGEFEDGTVVPQSARVVPRAVDISRLVDREGADGPLAPLSGESIN